LKKEVLAKAIIKAQETHLDELSTKHDLKELELRMENKFESIRGELVLLKWMMGFLLAGVISLILKAFFIS